MHHFPRNRAELAIRSFFAFHSHCRLRYSLPRLTVRLHIFGHALFKDDVLVAHIKSQRAPLSYLLPLDEGGQKASVSSETPNSTIIVRFYSNYSKSFQTVSYPSADNTCLRLYELIVFRRLAMVKKKKQVW